MKKMIAPYIQILNFYYLKVYEQVIDVPKDKRKRLNKPEGMPVAIGNLMEACMKFDDKRDERPSFEQIEKIVDNIYRKM